MWVGVRLLLLLPSLLLPPSCRTQTVSGQGGEGVDGEGGGRSAICGGCVPTRERDPSRPPAPHSTTSRWTSEASARQMGQVRLVFNHLSTHLAWNSWLHGNTRSNCLHSKSQKHTTHSVCSDR